MADMIHLDRHEAAAVLEALKRAETLLESLESAGLTSEEWLKGDGGRGLHSTLSGGRKYLERTLTTSIAQGES